mgnify:FL=1
MNWRIIVGYTLEIGLILVIASAAGAGKIEPGFAAMLIVVSVTFFVIGRLMDR